MLKSFLFLAITAGAFAVDPFYRRDYTYVSEFDAFYKVHWDKDGVSYNTAFISCDYEGAQLFYPTQKEEWTVVKNLSSKIEESLNTTEVIVGIHDETRMGEFITVDGQSTPYPLNLDETQATGDCIIMDFKTGLFKTEKCVTDPLKIRLYVCKKIDEKPCATIDLAYKYVEGIKKCYKLNKKERTWQDAFNTCFMEGGTLAFPESYVETKQIETFLTDGTETESQNYHLGFKRLFPRSNFYTIKGKQLNEIEVNKWNLYTNEPIQDCGAILYRKGEVLYFNTIACDATLPFLCELKSRY